MIKRQKTKTILCKPNGRSADFTSANFILGCKDYIFFNMKTTKTTLVVDTYICDATGTNMVSFSHKAPEKMIGGILQLNSSYCGIADGFDGLEELHLSREVTEKVLRFLLNEYPKTRENELIQHCLSK